MYHISILYRTIFSFVCFYSTLFFCTTFYSLHNLHDVLQFIMINSISLQTAFDFVKIFLRESFQKHPPDVFCKKRRLWHRCFPVNFAKFLRTLFLTEHLWATASEFSLNRKQHFKTRKEMEGKELLQAFLKKISLLYQVSAISLY